MVIMDIQENEEYDVLGWRLAICSMHSISIILGGGY